MEQELDLISDIVGAFAYRLKVRLYHGDIHRTVTNAMGMAKTQCSDQSCQEIRSLCRCVITKVIRPVAVVEVNNCSKNSFIVLYSPNGSTR